MGLNAIKQETLMYQSRLLLKHINVETASDRSLLFTIRTDKVSDHEHFKRAIYQKPHRVLYGTLSAPDNFTYSMMIAGDVECSKTGTVSLETLKNPYEPHYHGVMVFSKSDWCRIEPNLSEVIGRIKSAIYDIREVKKPLIDDDGVCTWDTVWIENLRKVLNQGISFPHRFQTTSITYSKLIIMHRSMVSNLMYQVFFLMTFIHQRISLHQQNLFLINYVLLKRRFSRNGKRI